MRWKQKIKAVEGSSTELHLPVSCRLILQMTPPGNDNSLHLASYDIFSGQTESRSYTGYYRNVYRDSVFDRARGRYYFLVDKGELISGSLSSWRAIDRYKTYLLCIDVATMDIVYELPLNIHTSGGYGDAYYDFLSFSGSTGSAARSAVSSDLTTWVFLTATTPSTTGYAIAHKVDLVSGTIEHFATTIPDPATGDIYMDWFMELRNGVVKVWSTVGPTYSTQLSDLAKYKASIDTMQFEAYTLPAGGDMLYSEFSRGHAFDDDYVITTTAESVLINRSSGPDSGVVETVYHGIQDAYPVSGEASLRYVFPPARITDEIAIITLEYGYTGYAVYDRGRRTVTPYPAIEPPVPVADDFGQAAQTCQPFGAAHMLWFGIKLGGYSSVVPHTCHMYGYVLKTDTQEVVHSFHKLYDPSIELYPNPYVHWLNNVATTDQAEAESALDVRLYKQASELGIVGYATDTLVQDPPFSTDPYVPPATSYITVHHPETNEVQPVPANWPCGVAYGSWSDGAPIIIPCS
jgi:hypothetical protein